MLKKILLAFVLIAAGLFSYFWLPYIVSYNPLAQYDMKRLCKLSKSYDFKNVTQDQGMIQIIEFSHKAKKLFYSKSAKSIYDSAYHMSDEQKWELFEMGFSEIGMKNYKCPSLKEALLYEF